MDPWTFHPNPVSILDVNPGRPHQGHPISTSKGMLFISTFINNDKGMTEGDLHRYAKIASLSPVFMNMTMALDRGDVASALTYVRFIMMFLNIDNGDNT